MNTSSAHSRLIGIDCGTTAVKGVLCRADGTELARAQHTIPLLTPNPGWAEQDPEAVWAALCDVVRALTARADAPITALSIAAQAGSIIPADAHGRPIYPMITFLDTRAAGLVAAWQRDGWSETVRDHTGWSLQIGQPIASIAWLRAHRPDVFAAAGLFIEPHDDLVRRLTGRVIGNPSCAAQIPLIDRRNGDYALEIAAAVGLAAHSLPPLAASGSAIGPAKPDVAEALGLSRDTLIVTGGQDHACEALALGLIDPGGLMLSTGTAWVITGIADCADLSAIPRQMDLNVHVAPQRWTISTYMGGFGAVLAWWLSGAPGNPHDPYARLEHALEMHTPDRQNPYFLPESQQRPASAFAGLRLSHRWDDMACAVVEGIAFETRRMIDALRAAALPVQTLYMLGGAARSSRWARTLADVLDTPIRACDDTYLGARGAAILAGLGAGVLPSIAQAWPGFAPHVEESTPDPTRQAAYQARFERYCALSNYQAAFE
ncbi:MAG: FGGY family carbohydrate kinase [Anaerolineae bacterium]|nr:FGGY family carbohydrate kinase [Thermoflexales bacterium]MDW8407047.1 FGGY family carbohydrate kinase [Anaerolineae bacterium]